MSGLAHVRTGLARGGGPPAGLVVAVSGGADSVALLRALVEIGEPGGRLVVAHLNHGLRGAESDGDEAFVRELCGGLPDVEFRGERIDVRAAGGNLEAAARRERYAWLSRVAGECGLAWGATGHTADDQAETVLHRLLRGAGLQGLRGIAVGRELRPGVTVVRPLLGATRAEVLDFLREIGQPFHEDRSNLDLRFTRN